ncbi:methionine adenosyltransferase domain-containing protein [Candidatus Saccharibacteria bacterium]|nr:methionine adenosyltransferase domain-containing protein [Candidatus Saccharibacteria bacterium]
MTTSNTVKNTIVKNPLRNLDGYRTAESVSPKHPDKLCDRISDAILDAHLAEDEKARVAVDVAGGHGKVFVAAEITSRAKNVNIEKIVHRIAGNQVEVVLSVVSQSPEIAQGVDTGGAGDQGIMIGYATDETPELLPREVVLSRNLNKFIYKKYPYDGKTQVTLHGRDIDSIVASFQNVSQGDLRNRILAWLVQEQLATSADGEDLLAQKDEDVVNTESKTPIALHINPAGDWNLGGFDADSGLTGRKLAVDNYGPSIPVGGGAFSGKDPSKVDRSAAYIARRIAVDYLREREAHEVYVRLAYAIGYAEPLERTVIIDGIAEEIPAERYDLTPRGIIKTLDLLRPIYEQTAEYGHFGEGFDWDR